MIVCFSFLTFLDLVTSGKYNGMSGVGKRYILLSLHYFDQSLY